jgi:hypothetical protein
MLLNYIFISCALLGTLILFIINTKYKNLSRVNIFLQIPIAITSIRFFLIGINQINKNNLFFSLIKFFEIITSLTIPSFYLYIRDLVTEEKNIKNSYSFFFFPLILITIIILAQTNIAHEHEFELKLSYMFVFFIYSIFILYLCYNLIRNNIWNRKSDIKSLASHEKIIFNWVHFLTACIILLFIRFFVFFGVSIFNHSIVFS